MRNIIYRVLAGLFALGITDPIGQISTTPACAAPQPLAASAGKQELSGSTEAKRKNESGMTAERSPEDHADQCGTPKLSEGQAVAPEVAQAKAGFAMDLITRLSPKNQNVSVSPFGLSAILSTLDLGADPAFRKAIIAMMRLSPGAGKFEELRKESRLINLAVQRDPRRFMSFNAVFVDHRLPLKAGIKDLAAAEGDVDVQSIDFESQASIDSVNDLLAKKANGRIKSILEPGSAPSLVTSNVLVFKDCWKTPFDKSKTVDKSFTLADGGKVKRSTMLATADSIGYRSAGQFVAVEIPYLDEEFALTLVTTQHEPAKAVDFKDAVSLLAGIDLVDVRATLSMPKFGGQVDNDLLDTLSAMGLKPGLASANQLPGFADGLRISRVRQKTWLAVDEVGTEAAAVTAAVATRSAPDPKVVSVDFDKPFVYALRYRPTGAILVAGYVGDPVSPRAPH